MVIKLSVWIKSNISIKFTDMAKWKEKIDDVFKMQYDYFDNGPVYKINFKKYEFNNWFVLSINSL